MGLKSLNILMVVLILGCPFWCGLGICSSVGECCGPQVAACDCCSHQHSPSECSRQQESDPADHGPSSPFENAPCGKCQCICGGALIELRDVDTTQLADDLLEFVYFGRELVSDVLVRQNSLSMQLPDGSISPGRLLCLLHMSLLI